MLTKIRGYSMRSILKHWPNRANSAVFTDPIDYVNSEGWQELAYQRDAYETAEGMLYSLTPMEQLMLMEFIILSKEEENV